MPRQIWEPDDSKLEKSKEIQQRAAYIQLINKRA